MIAPKASYKQSGSSPTQRGRQGVNTAEILTSVQQRRIDGHYTALTSRCGSSSNSPGKNQPRLLTHLGKLISQPHTCSRTAECCWRNHRAGQPHYTPDPNLNGAGNTAHPSLYAFLVDLLFLHSLLLILLQSLFSLRFR